MKKKNLIFAERSTMCGSSELKSAVVRRAMVLDWSRIEFLALNLCIERNCTKSDDSDTLLQ